MNLINFSEGTSSEAHFYIAKSGLKQVGKLMNGVGDGLSYSGMVPFQPEIVAAGEIISNPGTTLD